jgi:signal peptidase I
VSTGVDDPADVAPPEPAPPITEPEVSRAFSWLGPTVGPWIELIVVVALAFGAAYVVQWLVVKPYRIPSESMEDTLLVGDRVLVARFWYRFQDLERGDVIVFHPPGTRDEVIDRAGTPARDLNFIKRVVGLPGEWVGGYGGRVWICTAEPPGRRRPSGACKALGEAYVSSSQRRFRFQRVPKGEYFVMGDNRDNSDDSRVIGTIPRGWVLGRAFMTYWPIPRVARLA